MSRFQAKEDIFCDRKIGCQIQFLINNRDTFRLRFRWISEFDGLSIKLNCSRIWLMNSCDDLHQRAFSSAILPYHRVDALLLNFECDVQQRLDAGETLRDSVDLEDRGHDSEFRNQESGVAGVRGGRSQEPAVAGWAGRMMR